MLKSFATQIKHHTLYAQHFAVQSFSTFPMLTQNFNSFNQSFLSVYNSDSKYSQVSHSPLRSLTIGGNYFKYIHPYRKKTLMTLLNSYLKQFLHPVSGAIDVKNALDIFYNKEYNGIKLDDPTDDSSARLLDKEANKRLDFSEQILWHLNMFLIFERTASLFSRFEFTDYVKFVHKLKRIPKEKRNRSKFVFTAHPTQPNSIEQLKCIAEILKGLEENDLNYLDQSMASLVEANRTRVFKKPSYLEESVAYHSICIPNFIHAFAVIYDFGFKELSDYFETPGTWLTFDFDNHPEMALGLMTYTHGHTLKLTVEQYLKIIYDADIKQEVELEFVIRSFEKIILYANELMTTSDQFRSGIFNKTEFFKKLPRENIYELEDKIRSSLENITSKNRNLTETSKKILELMKIFRLIGCIGQVRLPGEELQEEANVKQIYHDILNEIAILNSNYIAGDMLIIANYEYQKQYDLVSHLLKKYNVQNMEIVPLLETFSSTNDTTSAITMVASSDTRQRDGLLLTELRTLWEYKKNPEKFIYMGQGITAERGGGPFRLLHQKYYSLTKMQRIRHIRTVQGHYFTSEFCSRDILLSFIVNSAFNINKEPHFEPSQEYMDFLFELDNIVGVPQREMQSTVQFNQFYEKNPIIKTLVETFNYAGSRELLKPFENVKKQRAIVQAYINSDRCSFAHPELAFWDRVDDGLIHKMAQFYHENNEHLKYILYNYGFILMRIDLDFAKEEAGLDEKSEIYQLYVKGRQALMRIINHIGLSKTSEPLVEIFNQHLGLLNQSSSEENKQKFEAYRLVYRMQNYFVKKYLREKAIGMDEDASETERKIKILQSGLANISPFNGKG